MIYLILSKGKTLERQGNDMKYKMVTIDGEGIVKDYIKRSYIITRPRMEEMQYIGCHFVVRYTIKGGKVYKCCEDDKIYFITD